MIDEQQHKLECAARYLLSRQLGSGTKLMERMEKRHGKGFMDKIKAEMKIQHIKIKEAKIKAKAELKENMQRLKDSI